MAQNTTHAVMSQRTEDKNSLDDFPTPPWATRALIEHVILPKNAVDKIVLEPACGMGYMSEVLREYFRDVRSSDIYDYGYGDIENFLTGLRSSDSVDWVITNPPFKSAEQFILEGLRVAREGVAVLVRTVFLESMGRWNRLFRDTPCDIFAQFVERVPIVKGRVDPKATTATGYAWLIWNKHSSGRPSVVWIPPSRRQMEQAYDYALPKTRKNMTPRPDIKEDVIRLL